MQLEQLSLLREHSESLEPSSANPMRCSSNKSPPSYPLTAPPSTRASSSPLSVPRKNSAKISSSFLPATRMHSAHISSSPVSVPRPASNQPSSLPRFAPQPYSNQPSSSPISVTRPPSNLPSSSPSSVPRSPSSQPSASPHSVPRPSTNQPSASLIWPPSNQPPPSPLSVFRPPTSQLSYSPLSVPRSPPTLSTSTSSPELTCLPDIRLEIGRVLNIFPVYPPRQCYQLKLFHLLLMQRTPGTLTPSPYAPDTTLPALFNNDNSEKPSGSNSSNGALSKSANYIDIASILKKECAKVSVINMRRRKRKRKASIGTTTREIVIKPVCSDGYSGGDELREMLWNHAQAIMVPILHKLKPGIGHHGVEERVILGIVTRRIFARVIVRVTEEEEGENIWLGGIDESAGVVGMHLVVFGCEAREGSVKLWKLPKVEGMNIPEIKDGQGKGCRIGEWLKGMEEAWGEWKTVQIRHSEKSEIR